MLLSRFTTFLAACCAGIGNAAPTLLNGGFQIRDSDGLQDIVTWDEHSIFVRGERILFYSGEFHPFRLPVPDLWLDVFQKIKALGYGGVSFYVDWALLEGQQGTFRADGLFALEPFFDAAAEAGIYLLARPGPYINAEVSGGGFPGWLSRVNGTFRTDDAGFIHATDLYAASVGSIIAKAQITNGGPVILFQPENEYTNPQNNITFPNSNYFNYVMQQFRNAGIVVPMISNDASPKGIFAPGNDTVTAHVDIYGHDSYPQGFNCEQPYNWSGRIPTNFRQLHLQQSPSTPYSIVEFQGGSFDPWGGYGFENCAALTNEQFERIFYKNNWSFGVTVFNIYMTYGGTNWGNLGHPLGYTSYDYGSPISEDRAVIRAKYSETKLGANFLKVTPSYLTASPQDLTNGTFTDTADISVTPIYGNGSATALYVVRHSAYNNSGSTQYKFTASSSVGSIGIPQLSQLSTTLTLDGRDSKVHVVDYDLGGTNLLYSSAEIFTWQKYSDRTLLVLYGGAGETHEFALPSGQCTVTSGDPSTVATQVVDGHTVTQWQVTPASKVLACDDVEVHLLWRNDAYNWWALELPGDDLVGNYTSPSKEVAVIAGGYLMRSAQINDGALHLSGDVNMTSTIYVVGAPAYDEIFFNGEQVGQSPFTVDYQAPMADLPDLSTVMWSSLDSLPEVSSSYSDDAWKVADKTSTVNQFKPPIPEVLYASEYGFHSGSIIYRGHFQAPSDADQLELSLWSVGGFAYGYSVWLDSASIYQYPGLSTSQDHNLSTTLSNVAAGDHVLTVVIDHMGLTENFNPGNDTMREPRGLRSYGLTTQAGSAVPVTWKLTGNLGGEDYLDLTRGPLNEGGMYFERQGYHLPGAPLENAQSASPYDGFAGPGVRFYATTFKLDLPSPAYDIPLAFVFSNTTSTAADSTSAKFRCQLYVNGFQFGKYVNHIGPQTVYPVPEGILNYNGDNYVGLSLWNMEENSETVVKLGSLELKTSSTPVMSGRGRAVELSYQLPEDGWQMRQGAY